MFVEFCNIRSFASVYSLSQDGFRVDPRVIPDGVRFMRIIRGIL